MNHIRNTKRSRKIAVVLALLLGLLVVVPVLAEYLGPDRTDSVWVHQRKRCHYNGVNDPPGPGYDTCYLNLYTTPGGSCPSNVASYFNHASCGGGWPDSCGAYCSISLSTSIESCNAGDTGCTSVEHTIEYDPATISGNINCPQTGDNGYCTAAASLSLSGNEPLSGYHIIGLEGTHNVSSSFFCPGDSCSINLIEGDNDFTFWALSDWGDSSLMGSASRSVDTRPPSVSASASGTPGNGAWYVSAVTIEASASDPSPGSDLASFQAAVDGSGWSAYSEPITLNDGDHTVELLATDNAGWTDSASMSFQIDTIAPTTVISDPTGTWATGTIDLSGASSDLHLDSAEISYDGGSSWRDLSLQPDGSWSTTWDTRTVSSGSRSVQARARDLAGNVGAAASVTIQVDNGAPRIGIPASWPIWRRVKINVRDDGIGVKRVRLTIHSDEYGDRVYNWGSGPDDFKWDRRFGDIIAPIGGYPVEVEAWDKAGNKGSAWGEIVIPKPDKVEGEIEEEPAALSVEPPEEPSEPPSSSGGEAPVPPPTNTPKPPKVVSFGGESVPSTTSSSDVIATTTGSNNLLVGALAAAGISAATAFVLSRSRKREEKKARAAAAAARFNKKQRALEARRARILARRKALQRAAELAAAGSVFLAALAVGTTDTQSPGSGTRRCFTVLGHFMCFGESPTSYASDVCHSWEIDICSGDPDNLPRNDTVLAMSDTAYDMLRLENYPEWIDEQMLQERITMLLIAAEQYDFAEDETAYMLATAYGETRFGVIWDDDLDTLPNANMHNGLVENISERDANEDYGGEYGNGPNEGFKYRGHGFPQLTYKENYETYQRIFGDKYNVDIVEHPEILSDYPEISAEILAYGMDKGWLGHIELGGGDWIYGTFDNVRDHTGCSSTKACLRQFRVMINPGDDWSHYKGYADIACLFLENYDEDACYE